MSTSSLTGSRWTIDVALSLVEHGVATFTCNVPEAEFQLSGRVARTELGIVITRMEFESERSGGITASMSRHFPIGELLAYIRTSNVLADERREYGLVPMSAPPAEPEAVCRCGHSAGVRDRRGGRARITDEHLRAVALVYLEETLPGKGGGAMARMTAHFERPEGTVRTWLANARRQGWLGPGMKGRRGAEPGPRLLAELADKEADRV